jgi:hypothetical protein
MDKDDLDKESIGNNIAISNSFTNTSKVSVNFEINKSVGEEIIMKMKKQEAFENAPENIGDLHKLLEKYE